MVFASDVLAAYKPEAKTYQSVIKALGLEPSDCIMVAAHAYDLEAAASQYVLYTLFNLLMILMQWYARGVHRSKH